MKKLFIILLMSTICSAQKFEAENMTMLDEWAIPGETYVKICAVSGISENISLSGNLELNIFCRGKNGLESLEILNPAGTADTLQITNTFWDSVKINVLCDVQGTWLFKHVSDFPVNNCLSIDYVEFRTEDSISTIKKTVEIFWQANTEPDLAGYKLYYGSNSGQYLKPINIDPYVMQYELSLSCGFTYYFALTAYDTSDNESEKSNEVSITLECLNEDMTPPGKPVLTSVRIKIN